MALSHLAGEPGSVAQTAGEDKEGAKSPACLKLPLLSALLYLLDFQEIAMATYSTSDLSRRSGDIIAEALRRPVTITQRNKPRLVVLSIEDYRRLTARAETRTTGTLDTMPDELFSQIEDELGRLEKEEAHGADRRR